MLIMRGICAIWIFLLFFSSCKQEERKLVALSGTTPLQVLVDEDISLPVYNFDALEPMLHIRDNGVYIINFWATWCKPCVAELPYFEKITKNYSDKGVEVVLVSLDMPKKAEKQLIPFLRERKIKSQVVLLDDPKQNKWIPRVSENWSGAIPATVIFNKNKRLFYERSFSYEELEHELKKFIN